jgi:hypothetical protein
MYSAIEDQAVHFHLLHDKDLTRVEQRINGLLQQRVGSGLCVCAYADRPSGG